MTGEQLRLKLIEMGIQQKDLAGKMGMTKQNFSAMMKVADVKSGIIENICKILGCTIADFYSGNPAMSAPAIEKDDVTIPRSVLSQMSETIKNQQQTIDRLTAEKRAYHALATDAACAAAK